MEKKKVVLDQFDFIRAIACLGIVLYHFAVEYGRIYLIIMLVVLPMEIFTLQYFSSFQVHYYFIIIVK